MPVVIVGAGFSGTLLAAQLARRGVHSVLIEARGEGGAGAAYSTPETGHLLNVPAEGMSAWPDRPDDFAATWAEYGGAKTDFAPRLVYGRYLRAILEGAVASGFVRLVRGTATSAEKRDDGWLLHLADGSAFRCLHLVLATGNEPPQPPDWAQNLDRGFVTDPWSEQARRAIAAAAKKDQDVLIVGTGLTMIDTVLSLDFAGHEGRTVALSRRGLLPRSHAQWTPAPVGIDEVPRTGLKGLARWLRERSAKVGWIAAVNALRPHSQLLWKQLGTVEQRRFLRHARPWWDVHRHRIAPQAAKRISELVEAGRLEIIAGRVADALASDEGRPKLRIRRARADEEWRTFDLVLNCTGPLGSIMESANPLLRNLVEGGHVVPDGLGIGIAVDSASRAKGQCSLWAAGPLTKGEYWEITAVPDIRAQVAEMADAIATAHCPESPVLLSVEC